MKVPTFAMSAFAALALVASSGAALAVIGTPPTVTCNGKCESCLEMEQGGRCLKCGIDAKCMAGGDPGLSSDFTQMLKDHNSYRKQQCAAPLTWSGDLAAAAQAYAKTCPSNGNGGFTHDPNRGQVGENLFWGQGTSAPQAVKWWYDEIKDYDFNAPVWSSAVGHFTQVVWKDTTELGCGVAVCGGVNLWVCRYAPPGNWNVKDDGVMASQVGCGKAGLVGGGAGGGGESKTTPASPALVTVAVLKTVDVYDSPGGDGNKLGELKAKKQVSLVGPCQDDWCHVTGTAVPGGDGWVYSGTDYMSLDLE